MKKMKFISIVAFVLGLLSFTTVEVIHLSDLIVVETQKGNKQICLKDSCAFTGHAWSNDEKTAQIHFNDGEPDTIRLYHPNSCIAIFTVPGRSLNCYDNNGKELTELDFIAAYPDYMDKLGNIFKEIGNR